MPSRSGKRAAEAEDLNVVPILNVVTILIPFLLMAAQFVSLAVVNAVLPAAAQPEDDDASAVDLTVSIDGAGYVVSGSAVAELGQPAVAIPCRRDACPEPSAYDTFTLGRLLTQIKEAHPEQESVVIAPDLQIPFEVVVLTMDATREWRVPGSEPRAIFSTPVISAGEAP